MTTDQINGCQPCDAAVKPTSAHEKAFENYLRYGDEDGLYGLTAEDGQPVAIDGKFLAPQSVLAALNAVAPESCSLRDQVSVASGEGTNYLAPIDKLQPAANWGDPVPVDTGSRDPIALTIPLHDLSAPAEAGQRLLDDVAFEVQTWFAGQVAPKFNRAESAAIINGAGPDQPKGILSYPTESYQTSGEGTIGVVDAEPGAHISGTDMAVALINLVYSLGADHRANASFVMNSKMASLLRRIQDDYGRFLWGDTLSAEQPSKLLGYPVMISEDMPDIRPGRSPITFADFRAAYTLVERPDLRVLRSSDSSSSAVTFHAFKKAGGGVTNFDAVRLLRFN